MDRVDPDVIAKCEGATLTSKFIDRMNMYERTKMQIR